ncbi:hypothetical protein BDN67DRAFT_983606 [Paxillus ammoniavirescens]|nr:hypothetical protein BDN67DRAFT_983606 [Paxillus ammoniavirescens]
MDDLSTYSQLKEMQQTLASIDVHMQSHLTQGSEADHFNNTGVVGDPQLSNSYDTGAYSNTICATSGSSGSGSSSADNPATISAPAPSPTHFQLTVKCSIVPTPQFSHNKQYHTIRWWLEWDIHDRYNFFHWTVNGQHFLFGNTAILAFLCNSLMNVDSSGFFGVCTSTLRTFLYCNFLAADDLPTLVATPKCRVVMLAEYHKLLHFQTSAKNSSLGEDLRVVQVTYIHFILYFLLWYVTAKLKGEDYKIAVGNTYQVHMTENNEVGPLPNPETPSLMRFTVNPALHMMQKKASKGEDISIKDAADALLQLKEFGDAVLLTVVLWCDDNSDPGSNSVPLPRHQSSTQDEMQHQTDSGSSGIGVDDIMIGNKHMRKKAKAASGVAATSYICATQNQVNAHQI